MKNDSRYANDTINTIIEHTQSNIGSNNNNTSKLWCDSANTSLWSIYNFFTFGGSMVWILCDLVICEVDDRPRPMAVQALPVHLMMSGRDVQFMGGHYDTPPRGLCSVFNNKRKEGGIT